MKYQLFWKQEMALCNMYFLIVCYQLSYDVHLGFLTESLKIMCLIDKYLPPIL